MSMPHVAFEPTISADEWPQAYALDRAATGTGVLGLQERKMEIKIRNLCLAACTTICD